MFKKSFGTKQQIKFNSEADYYEFLGYLSKNDGSTKIVWEHNDEQGAWGQEGRIEFFFRVPTTLSVILTHTAGNSSILSRVNCNEYIENLRSDHEFKVNTTQDVELIRTTIPENFKDDFERGFNL